MLDALAYLWPALRLCLYLSSIAAVGSVLLANTMSYKIGTSSFFKMLRKQACWGAVLLALMECIRFFTMLMNFSDWHLVEAISFDMLLLGTEITSGQASLLRILMSLVLIISVFTLKSWRLALLPAIAIIISYTVEGHTASLEGTNLKEWLAILSLVIHLSLFHWWLAVLIPLRQLAKRFDPETAQIAHQFGTQALLFVPLVLISGASLMSIITDLPNQTLTTLVVWASAPYVITLIVKITFVTLVLVIACLNKLRHTPSLTSGSDTAFTNFRRSLEFEILLVMLVLTSTSWAIWIGIGS